MSSKLKVVTRRVTVTLIASLLFGCRCLGDWNENNIDNALPPPHVSG